MTAQPYYNAEGEMLGIDYIYDDAPDVEDFYDRDIEDEEPEERDPENCAHEDRNQIDLREGHAHLEEMPTREAIKWECIHCHTQFDLTAADWEDFYGFKIEDQGFGFAL